MKSQVAGRASILTRHAIAQEKLSELALVEALPTLLAPEKQDLRRETCDLRLATLCLCGSW